MRRQTKREERLLERLDADWRAAAEKAGGWLVCRPGCDDCCHRPFPVSRLDARRLRRGLAALGERDSTGAEGIRRRAREAVARLSLGFPGNLAAGRLEQDESCLDAYFRQHEGLACPALEPETGRCELYDWRPIACRTYGPPLRFGVQKAAPCRLCFDGASAATVERCRMEPDAEGIEQELLAEIGAPDWETLIAFALAFDEEDSP